MTTSKFLLMCLCPGTGSEGPRAQKAQAMYGELFPLTVTVNIRPGVANPPICPKCGAKRYKLTTESQVNTERMFGFASKEDRAVCEGMGGLIK